MKTDPEDICRNRHRGNATSVAVFDKFKDHLTKTEQLVYELLLVLPDATSKELAAKLGKDFHTVTPRISKLKQKGLVFETPYKRDNATVYVALRKGQIALF